ncbi:hypothetical protein D3C80_1337420 [compost metagenome]
MDQVNRLAFFAGDQAALDEVLQFPHVARKVIAQQDLQRAHGQAHRGAAVFLAKTLEEGIDQQRYVIATLAQGRQGDGVDVEPVEQVFTECAVRHGLAQVDVGGRDDPHIDLDAVAATDPFDFPFLQGAQQLALPGQAQAGDLIQEQRAAMGSLETPGA